jgi:hypothetical protein
MAVSKHRATYNRVRLALFLHSYGAFIISELLKSKNISKVKIINRLGQILNFDPLLLKKFYLDGTYARKLSKPRSYKKYRTQRERIIAYLEIEKELVNLINEKKEMDGTAIEDYDRALLEPAIERAAGNYLCKTEDDFEFEDQLAILRIKYKTYYYSVAYKYKLPTPRIVPFILRLIKN